MTYQLIFPDSYEKKVKKFLKQHPELKNVYGNTIRLLELDPFHTSLKLHGLKGNLKEIYSVSINFSYRIILELIIKDQTIILVNIGSHDKVY